MFSSNSAANLKIVGAEGQTPDSLRDEVDRGAKFVIYSYSISLLVLSFKRPSSIHFIRPGQNRVVKGLPFTLISFVFGWWGIPWGIVYTIQSLHQNLTGGTDVTRELLAAVAPVPVGKTTAAPAALPAPTPAPASAVSGQNILLLAGAVTVLAAVIYPIVCFAYGENLRVALVSGLKAPYSVEINGTSYRLVPKQPQIVTLAEGDFEMKGSPGARDVARFSARTDFFSRPFNRHVLVINPDRLAVVYRETTTYRPTASARDPSEQNAIELHANRDFYFVAEPDHFFEEFPGTIALPSGNSAVSKTRLTAIPELSLGNAVPLLTERLGYPAARDYLANFARLHPEDETLQRQIVTVLKPEDARPLLESRLGERPVLVEWHRAYQFFMDTHFQAVDLTAPYRKWMEAEPDDGVLIYLYARLLTDPAVSHPLYEKALHAKHPSPYAAYALATDEFADGHFAACLGLLRQAEQAGLQSDSLLLRKRETLLALGHLPEVLSDVTRRRAKDKTDAESFADELLLTQAQSPDRAAGQRAIASFLVALKERFGADDYQPAENYFNACLAYGLGDEREAAAFSAKLKGPKNAFESAIGRRDHAAAAKAVAGIDRLPASYRWLLMLTAHAAGDAAAAEKYFKEAVASLGQADKYSRTTAARILRGDAGAHAEILRTPNYAEELRVLYTALGVHFPAQREAYFARARDLDHDPSFPHLLLTAVRGDPAAPAP